MGKDAFEGVRTAANFQPDFSKLKFNHLVQFPHEYFVALKRVSSDEELYKKIETDKQLESEVELVDNILSLQVAIHTLGRTVGIDGSTVDTLRSMMSRLIRQYEHDFGKEFQDPNRGRL